MVGIVGPTGNRALDWFIGISIVVTASGVIWRKVLKPIVDSLGVWQDIAPVLGFTPDEDGKRTTIKDSLHDIVAAVSEVKEEVCGVKAEVTKVITAQNQQGEKLDTLHQYAHDTRHAQAGEITKLVLADTVIAAHLAELAASVSLSALTGDRIEAAQSVVAEDLAAAVGRADNAQGAEGAAADAASRSPETEK